MSRTVPEALLLRHAFPEQPHLDASARLQRFLQDYWRQRVLHVPGALGDFETPLDGDELAGLACEPGAEARIVRRTAAGFELEEGPFTPERFATIGDRDWTLLVNGVDLAIPGFEALLETVRFVPDWRLDDVMVSFAAPGGSVGPHFDRYDVFLLQAEGTRRWELSAHADGDRRPVQAGAGLQLVDDFEAEQTVVCHPGDGLYVPPGVVHHGIAESACLTISLGFRAPSAADLVTDWALMLGDRLSEAGAGVPLDLDPGLPADPAMLDDRTLAGATALLRTQLLTLLDEEPQTVARWLGELLSRPGRGASFDATNLVEPEALAGELLAGAVLERAPGLRLLLRADGRGGSLVFAGGEHFTTTLPPEALEPFTRLGPLTAADLTSPAALRLAADLCSAGRLELMEADQ
ncbi:MAG TPA: cupin domain-containing protein [Pseudomonadales bacterium]|nr:cupin domain-containing protein [Pseudomonadales bacterium]